MTALARYSDLLVERLGRAIAVAETISATSGQKDVRYIRDQIELAIEVLDQIDAWAKAVKQ